MSHTPGPWKLHLFGENTEPSVFSETNGLVVCDMTSGASSAAKYNANLITAAPDLLAVAKLIEDWMLCDEPKGGGQFIGALASAIAKAEGRGAE